MKGIADHLEDKYLLPEIKPGLETTYIKDILVDADALVALAKTNDSNHQKATKLSKKLQKTGVIYYFSPFTVAEAATVLSYKTSHQSAKKFLEQIRELDIPILELSEKHLVLADKWFFKQNRKGTSYFDCYNIALLDRYKNQLSAIFSFDSIYKRNGFTLVEDLNLS
jgi:predicted nucleic acid-binding protein